MSAAATVAGIEVRCCSGEAAPSEAAAQAPAWGELCDRAGVSPFLRPEWWQAHVRAFERTQDLRLLFAFRQGQLCGVLPLVAARLGLRGLPVRGLRAAANHQTLYFDLVCEPAEAPLVAAAMWHWLAAQPRWDVLELRDVPSGGRAELLLAAAAEHGCPTGHWTAPIQTRPVPATAIPWGISSSNFRHTLQRTHRRLGEQGEVRLETLLTADAAALTDFFALEAAGWKGRSGGNAILRKPPAVAQYYRELAQGSAASGRFRLHRLCCGGRPIAVSYGLVAPGSYYPLVWCYDEQFERFGPGHLLIQAILRECAAEGRSFAFIGEAFAYRDKWAPPPGASHQYLYVFPRSLRGRGLHTLKFRLPL